MLPSGRDLSVVTHRDLALSAAIRIIHVLCMLKLRSQSENEAFDNWSISYLIIFLLLLFKPDMKKNP